ncbi:MAG: glucose-1-phosphate thymidylyltransferase [Saprospiraceae bacterium]|nr:GlmU family protein [Bacteroidia bacterium]MBT8228895.1 GlmU family protein [Bacteroidia bacterium]NNF23078.1 glucose-1-phosphate thymidylyltransferase [Saprospiraceae bacterium]
MNNIILFDDDHWKSLLPMTFTRPTADLRVGILTIREKWEKYLDGTGSYITQDYLSVKFPIHIEEINFVINARYLPNKRIARLISQLEINGALLHDEILVAAKMKRDQFEKLINNQQLDEIDGLELADTFDEDDFIMRPHDIFRLNANEIRKDFDLMTVGRVSAAIPQNVTTSGNANIFIEEGATVQPCFLNASSGPIYIGKDSEVMEGAMIRGPFAMGLNSRVKMGAKIYGATSMGPFCKIGGEVNNVVLQAYSNKGHDGYLGNSVLGEWVNIGADTNSSNLKNNYTEVKTWDYSNDTFKNTGLQFCGCILGDHTKVGINTMFNTGTVTGVSCNIYGSGFPRTFIPSFSWGGKQGYSTYRIEKSIETAAKMMKRRGIDFSEEDKTILEHIFHYTSRYRHWEN